MGHMAFHLPRSPHLYHHLTPHEHHWKEKDIHAVISATLGNRTSIGMSLALHDAKEAGIGHGFLLAFLRFSFPLFPTSPSYKSMIKKTTFPYHYDITRHRKKISQVHSKPSLVFKTNLETRGVDKRGNLIISSPRLSDASQ